MEMIDSLEDPNPYLSPRPKTDKCKTSDDNELSMVESFFYYLVLSLSMCWAAVVVTLFLLILMPLGWSLIGEFVELNDNTTTPFGSN